MQNEIEMRNKLSDIVYNSKTDKHKYNVSKIPELYTWVMEYTKNEPINSTFLHRIYVALNETNSICVNGKNKKFSGNLNFGFIHCGNFKVCECAKKNHSEKISASKKAMSKEDIDSANEKRRRTNLTNTGYEYNSQNPIIKKQKEETFMKKYGVKTSLLSPTVKEKIKDILISRYGVDHPSKSKEVKHKTQATNLKRYGNVCALQNPTLIATRRKKSIEKYGVELFHKIRFNDEQQAFLTNKDRLVKELEEFGYLAISNKYQIHVDILAHRLKKWGVEKHKNGSAPEEFVKNVLLSSDTEFKFRDRTQIKPYELDFYIPSSKIAIEVCGLYWHSEVHCESNYHAMKLSLCEKMGIKLLTIFSDEIQSNPNLIKTKILHYLGKNNESSIGARKCIVKEISSPVAISFLKKNHIQGSAPSKIKIGAFFNDELVAVMTFSTNRNFTGDKTNYTELVRFATSKKVSGIASKMFNYFVRNYYPEKIISYADRRWSTGELYYILGFKLTKTSKPNYWYSNKFIKREHRYNFTKSKLVKLGYDPSLSETEITKIMGYSKIWDCGTLRFEWTASYKNK